MHAEVAPEESFGPNHVIVTVRLVGVSDETIATRHWYHVPRKEDRVELVLSDGTSIDADVLNVTWRDDEVFVRLWGFR